MPRRLREQLILDIAGQVFARGGYHFASMDAIAERAGVSKPMIYSYFGSKEGLYVAYVHRAGRELLDRLLGAAGRDDPPLVQLRARIAEFLSFVEEHRDGWIVLFTEMSCSRPLEDEVSRRRHQIADAVRRMVEASVSGYEKAIDAADDEEAIHAADDEQAMHLASDGIAHAIVGAGESLANWWLEHPDVDREQVADWYFGIVQGAVPAALRPSISGRP